MKLCHLGIAVFIVGISWALIRWIELFDWGRGVERAGITLMLFLLIAALYRKISFRLPLICKTKMGKNTTRILLIACLLLGAWQAHLAFTRMKSPHLIDVATTTIEAGKIIKNGQNPYTTPMDPRPESNIYFKNFDGFKYLPAMALSYLPSTFRGDSDLILLNYFFQILTAIVIFLISRRIAGDIAGAVGILFYLTIPLLSRELYKTGVTDLAAVLPCLLALNVRNFSPLLSGIFVGFAFSAKLLPAILIIPILCYFPNQRPLKNFALWGTGFIIGNLPTVWFLIQSPMDLINNAILYSFYREVDSTSWMYGWPLLIKSLASITNLLILIGVTIYCFFKTLTEHSRVFLAMGVSLVTPLLGPINHRNYQIWWLPWFCIMLALCIRSLLEETAAESPSSGTITNSMPTAGP